MLDLPRIQDLVMDAGFGQSGTTACSDGSMERVPTSTGVTLIVQLPNPLHDRLPLVLRRSVHEYRFAMRRTGRLVGTETTCSP